MTIDNMVQPKKKPRHKKLKIQIQVEIINYLQSAIQHRVSVNQHGVQLRIPLSPEHQKKQRYKAIEFSRYVKIKWELFTMLIYKYLHVSIDYVQCLV
jgi:hypothetical protein